MIKFKELTIRNFLSYGNNTTKLKLDFTKPTLIVGKNYDSVINGQVGSNGAGKSTILNAVAFCLYDKTMSGIDKANVVNYTNKKNMEVSITFERDGTFYKVERYRKNKGKGGDGVRVFANKTGYEFKAEHDKTPDSVSNANAFVEKTLGIPFEIFSRIVVFHAQYEPFLNLPASHTSKANQRDIIEELFGLTELSRKADSLKELISTTKQRIKLASEKISYFEAEKSRVQDQLESISRRMNAWEENKKSEMAAIKTELKELVKVDFDSLREILKQLGELGARKKEIEREISKLNEKLSDATNNNRKVVTWERDTKQKILELSSELEELKAIDVEYLREVQDEVSELSASIKQIDTDMTSLSSEKQAAIKEHHKLVEVIESLDDSKCPYCKQAFHDTAEKRSECEGLLTNIQKRMEVLNEELEGFIALRERKKIRLDELVKVKVPDLNNITTKIKIVENSLQTLMDSRNPYETINTMPIEGALMDLNTELESIRSEISNKWSDNGVEDFYIPKEFAGSPITESLLDRMELLIDNLTEKFKSVKAAGNPHKETYDEVLELLENVSTVDTSEVDALDKELSHQEFLLKLLTKKDSFVRKALLNKNIPYLNTRLAHYLNTMGLEHKVLFTEEMGVSIKKFGTEYDHSNLSTGQKARVNLALSFAFRDVLQARFEKISFCILDECLDTGLDTIGVQLAAKMVKTVAKEDGLAMFIVSHKDEISTMFDSKLEVELKRGFSNVLPGPLSSSTEDNPDEE